MKIQLGSEDIFFPVPPALIVSGNGEENDVLTVAWVGFISSTPPTIGVSLDKSRHSLSLIRKFRQFTVNIPSADQFKGVDYCGLVSGKKRNKFEDTGFTLMKGSKTNTGIIKECPFNMECHLVREVELGDYIFLMGEVVETHVDEDKTSMENGKLKIEIAKVDPLVYCATIREYWSIGNKLGNAFNAGKEIINSIKSKE